MRYGIEKQDGTLAYGGRTWAIQENAERNMHELERNDSGEFRVVEVREPFGKKSEQRPILADKSQRTMVARRTKGPRMSKLS